MKGFFSQLDVPDPRKSLPVVSNCSACGAQRGCRSPKMDYSGRGEKGILIVGFMPTRSDDSSGEPFTDCHPLLKRILGSKWERDYWFTNAVLCSQPDASEKQYDKSLDHCRPNLMQTIRELEPHTVVLMGGSAVYSMVSHLWKEAVGSIDAWKGRQIPCQALNTWLCPTDDLAACADKRRPAASLWFERHLRAALALSSRPFAEVPNYASQCEIIEDSGRAASILRKIRAKSGTTVAFDYETTNLKPDSDDSAIYSCSVSWMGKKTIAFPWVGEAVTAMAELLFDPSIEKEAHNAKFEERWTRAVLGKGVANWGFDTMIGAHVLDSTEGTKSLKFQAFARLGQADYASEVSPYLEADGSYSPNRIKQVPLEKLLLYNALDSLLEFKLGEIQKADLKRRFK